VTSVPAKARFFRRRGIVSSASGSVCWGRHGFAGERGFVHLQVARVEQPQVRGHAVARLEQDHVARHQFHGADALLASVAPHRRLGDHHAGQRFDGFLRLRLLEKSDDGVMTTTARMTDDPTIRRGRRDPAANSRM
jgi:hypothetical protein